MITPEYSYDDNSHFDDLLHRIVGINYMAHMFYDLIQGECRIVPSYLMWRVLARNLLPSGRYETPSPHTAIEVGSQVSD